MQHGSVTAGIALTLIQKGAEVKPFRKKGFPVYNHMIPLMPNHVRGTHAFRPSDQTFGAIVNQPTSSNSNMPPPAPRGDIDEDDAAINSDDNEQVAPLSSPPRPPISTSSTSVNSFASRQSKRKHSALGDGDSASIPSGSRVSSQDKRQRNTGASALVALSAKMDRMNDTFETGFAHDAKARAHRDKSPQHRAQAVKAFSRLEKKNLTNDQKVAMLDLFEVNTAVADIFLAMDEEDAGLRRAWILNKLAGMGHPPLAEVAEMSTTE